MTLPYGRFNKIGFLGRSVSGLLIIPKKQAKIKKKIIDLGDFL